ncbi:hypothetical protein ACH5RR_026648 [Cinchona calisaya]|uniref:GAG-pre-integrase domain-containing protein n=1 Tax=Cinchona calisaya TaxID=153742 RepID=A0ABD2Z3B2_9GENT
MSCGYSVLFDDSSCTIQDKELGQPIVNVKMTANKMFLLEISTIECHALVASSEKDESELWHLRYGNLNVRGLKLLSEKEMVYGLPKIESIEVCEGCMYMKQSRSHFL